ncbi:MAG: hypothetical protein Q9219_000890 [cf. Caloplaca sp. 3 TL-2023]
MKRKLDEKNVPSSSKLSQDGQQASGFKSFALDPRLLQAITKEGFTTPTPVQSRVIPQALQGKDLLVRARTGSGKTAAYLLPLLEILLRQKKDGYLQKGPAALILLPTYELGQQTSKVVSTFTVDCHKDIRIADLTRKVPDNVQRSLLADSPDIVIATPARAALCVANASFLVDNLSLIVIDEADLILSYGYEEDLQTIAKSIPTGVQKLLMSATLTTEIDILKNLYCRDPVTLELDDQDNDKKEITQYIVKCAEDEKFLLAFVIFKLQLIRGKCIVFVADIERCYRLKLFLEQFGVKGCVLNSLLPVNSRFHAVEEFNKGVYNIIIASDECEVLGDEQQSSDVKVQPLSDPKDHSPSDEPPNSTTVTVAASENSSNKASKEPSTQYNPPRPRKKHHTTKDSKEYGVSRGIDFKNVACVLNFDLPLTSKSYTHRIGRTARAGQTGMALSFVVPPEQYLKHKHTSIPTAKYDENTLAKIIQHQKKDGREVKPYEFDMKQVNGFRYRVNDALRAVTQTAIRDARIRELKQEVLKSEKLKRHFEENPADLQHLRHDGELRSARVQSHLKHVPEYLLPSTGRRGIASTDIGFVGIRKTSENRIRKAKMQKRMSGKGRKLSSRRPDPLQTFNAKGRR